MSAATIAFIQQILQWMPLIIQGGKMVAEFAIWGQKQADKLIAEDRNPTEAEWAELNRKTAELRRLLHSDDV